MTIRLFRYITIRFFKCIVHKMKYLYHNLYHAEKCTKLKDRCYLYEMQWNMMFFLIIINFDQMLDFYTKTQQLKLNAYKTETSVCSS